LLGDRVCVYTRESNVGTAAMGLAPAGKEVQRFNLPFPWNVSAGVLAQGPTHLQALEPATGATVRDYALGERLALEPRVRAISYQGLLVVGSKGGRVLGYSLPRD
jgi:hypothetical protein